MFERLEKPTGLIDVVLDTDTFNEIDDQFAISYMFANQDRINIKGINAAPFRNQTTTYAEGMELSYMEILKLLKFMGNEDFTEVYRGSTEELKDELTPVISPAATNLAKLAMNYSEGKPLYVVAIGAITNVASAILINPEIAKRMVVVWLGGNAIHWPNGGEFNLNGDIAAARVVMKYMRDAFVLLPCMGVVSQFTTTESELRTFLGGKNELSDYLIENAIAWTSARTNVKCWSKVVWDVTAIAWLINDDNRFMKDSIEKMPLISYESQYSYPENNGYMRYVYDIHRDNLYEDLFNKLSNKENFKYIKR